MIPRAFVSAFLLPTAIACIALHAPFSCDSRAVECLTGWLASWSTLHCTALHRTALHYTAPMLIKQSRRLVTSQQLSGSIDPLLPVRLRSARSRLPRPPPPLPQLCPKLVCSVVV